MHLVSLVELNSNAREGLSIFFKQDILLNIFNTEFTHYQNDNFERRKVLKNCSFK